MGAGEEGGRGMTAEITEQVLETARERLGMCVPEERGDIPGIVFGLKHGVLYGCTDGWLWCIDHAIGVVVERTDLPNAGDQKMGGRVLKVLSGKPTKLFEMAAFAVGSMGGIAKTQLGLYHLTKLSEYGIGIIWGVGEDPGPDAMVQIWTTEVDQVPTIHLRYGPREAALAGCTGASGLWNPTYDLPLEESTQ